MEEHPQGIDRLTLIPSDGGKFEVEIDGELVWSKKQTKQFPEYEQIAPSLG